MAANPYASSVSSHAVVTDFLHYSLGKAWNSFWHTMTSKDRHASHDSPYRTGQHVPLSQNRHAPLSSIATSAAESRPDLASPYEDELSKQRSGSTNGWAGAPASAQSPSRPYSPGMRSLTGKSAILSDHEVVSPGEIQMQNFADGAPPAPPASHSWKKIDRWAEKNYEELYDQLGEGCTQNDINELEHELDCSLPQDVRDSLGIHDGQERGGRPTGIIFGCMLLDCEEIVQEWNNWKVVNEEYLSGRPQAPQAHYPLKGLNAASSSTSVHSQNGTNKMWREELLDKQDSQPPKAIQKAYSHPGWIPLARDWGGNNIAVDLAPGPMGKWGQVILFGRDYDCKYVIARSWGVFLSVVADDMESDKVIVDEESGELKLREFKSQNVEPGYLDILRWRADQKYGQRRPKRAPLNLNTNLGKSPRESPYNSPTIGNDEGGRGRSPQRFSRGPNASPRTQMGSPLARHHEEVIAPIPVRAGGDIVKDFATTPEEMKSVRREKLVDVPTPTVGVDMSKAGFEAGAATPEVDQEQEHKTATGVGATGADEMKSVQI